MRGDKVGWDGNGSPVARSATEPPSYTVYGFEEGCELFGLKPSGRGWRWVIEAAPWMVSSRAVTDKALGFPCVTASFKHPRWKGAHVIVARKKEEN